MHNGNSHAIASARQQRRFLIGLAVYMLLLHSLLLIYDYTNGFTPFYRVDRADNRVDAMHNLLDAHTQAGVIKAIVTNNIIAGEYLLQTGLFHLGGAFAVIVFQIVLQLCSVFAVYRIALLTIESPRLSFASALLYATLPHSIAFPHQFASEALAVPFVVLAFWLLVEYLIADASWVWLIVAGGLCGMAACMRPVLLILPACLSLCVLAKRGGHTLRDMAALVIAGAVPAGLLVALYFSATHELSLGNTYSGMGYNLYLRAMKVAATLPPEDTKVVNHRFFGDTMTEKCIGNPIGPDGLPCTMSTSTYVSFALHYPVANARYFMSDVVTFAVKSGVSSITTNYLDLSPQDEKIMDDKSGWHAVWNTQGLYAAIVMVFKANPLITIVELAGGGLFLLLFGCFLAGCREVWQLTGSTHVSRPRIIALSAMALLPLYIFATSETSEYMHSRYRYPGEFAMCILAVYGAALLRRRFQKYPHPAAAPL